MYILSQNKMRLINSECFREFAILPGEDGAELHAVDLDGEPTLLGTFRTEKHAVKILEFLQYCLTDAEAQTKCTDIPSAEDAAFADQLSGRAESTGAALREMLKNVSSAEGFPDFDSLRRHLLNL